MIGEDVSGKGDRCSSTVSSSSSLSTLAWTGCFFHVLHLGAAATDESRGLAVNLLLLNLQEKDEHFCCCDNPSSSCWNGKPQLQHQRQ
jgi:hypothetical protein